MAKFEVDAELVIHVTVAVPVEAASKEEALDSAMDLLPMNVVAGSAEGWRAKVEVTKPKGVRVKKVIHFDTASGGKDRVRKVSE